MYGCVSSIRLESRPTFEHGNAAATALTSALKYFEITRPELCYRTVTALSIRLLRAYSAIPVLLEHLQLADCKPQAGDLVRGKTSQPDMSSA